MPEELLHKTNTGISSEFFVAGELARRGFNVTLTFGNTKAIDLLVEKDGKLIPIQVKGIQRTSSICWNLSIEKLKDPSLIFVLVNLHADTLQQPEYFILTAAEAKEYFKPTKLGRDYLDYNLAVRLNLNKEDKWDKILNSKKETLMTQDIATNKAGLLSSMYWDGYCPESALAGKKVRMRLNSDDFYESVATGLQIAIWPGVQAIIMNFRGKGEWRTIMTFADEIENGEILSPQTTDYPPFNNNELFKGENEVVDFIQKIK